MVSFKPDLSIHLVVHSVPMPGCRCLVDGNACLMSQKAIGPHLAQYSAAVPDIVLLAEWR